MFYDNDCEITWGQSHDYTDLDLSVITCLNLILTSIFDKRDFNFPYYKLSFPE